MSKVYSFSVVGEVPGKGRPRMTRTGRAYTDAKTRAAEKYFAEELAMQWPLETITGAVILSIDIMTARPKGHWLKDGSMSAAGRRQPFPTRKPDIDNQVKLVLDSMVNAKIIADDTQVIELHATRAWCVHWLDGRAFCDIKLRVF